MRRPLKDPQKEAPNEIPFFALAAQIAHIGQ